MVTGKKHIGKGVPRPHARPGVVGIFQQARLEALLAERLFRAEHPVDEPDAGIDDDHCREFAAREHVVADRHLLQAMVVDDALVDALEPAGEHHNAGAVGELANAGLG